MMMSNPPSSLQSRQKLHQRQNSTPVAFEAMKVQMPPTTTQRQPLHRRGQSYDMTRTPIRRQQYTGSAVSIPTNLGPTHGQQILREAQQQRIARPGQPHLQPRLQTPSTQQCGVISVQQFPSAIPYDMSTNAIMSSSDEMMPHSFENMPMNMSLDSHTPYMIDENMPNYFQMYHPIQNQQSFVPLHDRRMSQPDLRIQTSMRPYTPTQQLQTAHFPLTPAQTPMQQHAVMQPTKPIHNSPHWQPENETIVSPRPVSMLKSRSLQGITEHQAVDSFNDIAQAPELSAISRPVPLREPTKSRRAVHNKSGSLSVPQDEKTALFGEITESVLDLGDEDTQPNLSPSRGAASPARPALSPRRMSISDLHLEPGISASIEETNVTLDDIAQFIDGPDSADNKWVCKFEGCDKRFGRKENIKSHVQTHLGDRQFKCNHCEKCFVRGHDLKRHAKIHTGSKAYACLCGNAFARHDALTRHRQRGMCVGAFEGIVRKEVKRGRPKKHRPDMDDRLGKASRTRHRRQQDSVTLSEDLDAYVSSSSSCSMSSWDSPSAENIDNLSVHEPSAGSPELTYDDTMHLFGFAQHNIDLHSRVQLDPGSQATLLPGMFSFTPPASPGFSTGNKPSPCHRELTPVEFVSFEQEIGVPIPTAGPMHHGHGHASQVSLPPHARTFNHVRYSDNLDLSLVTNEVFDLPTVPGSLRSLVASTQTTSVPALSHSSSPPPQEPTSALAFDFPDENPLRMSTMSSMSFGLSADAKCFAADSNATLEDPQRNEFDSFLDYNDDSQISLGLSMGLDGTDAFFGSLRS